MKNFLPLMLIATSFSTVVHARKYVPKKIDDTHLKKELVSNNKRVNGLYLFAIEGVAKVENEKELSDIIGLRSNFKDRLNDQTQRY